MREKIKEALRNILGIDNIADDTSQQTCEAWDSMHHLQLIIELEEKFNVSFEPEDISEMRSLSEIENKVKNLINM
jgi:acyl carrier protein